MNDDTSLSSARPAHGASAPLLRALGALCLGLGVAGAFLPLLPTTPLLLLATWCFARSEPRLERWILDHPRFGPPFQAWRRHGAISGRAKLLASVLLLGGVAVAFAWGLPPWLLGLHAAIVAAVLAFLLTRPSRRPGAPAPTVEVAPATVAQD